MLKDDLLPFLVLFMLVISSIIFTLRFNRNLNGKPCHKQSQIIFKNGMMLDDTKYKSLIDL